MQGTGLVSDGITPQVPHLIRSRLRNAVSCHPDAAAFAKGVTSELAGEESILRDLYGFSQGDAFGIHFVLLSRGSFRMTRLTDFNIIFKSRYFPLYGSVSV